MPPLEDMDRLQRATLWVKTGDDDQGEPILAPGVGIDVRWVMGQSEALDRTGSVIALDATAVLAMDEYVPIDSLLALGEPEDFVGTADFDLYSVKTIGEVPDLKGRFTRRTVGMMRFRGSLPEVQ